MAATRQWPQPEIRFMRQRTLLRVHVAGESTLENTVAYWQAIVDEVRRERPEAILLIDELQGERLTGVQWRQLVETMAGHGLEPLRIAHVKPMGLQQIEHCEIYAREAGFHSRVFDDERRAELWLRYGES